MFAARNLKIQNSQEGFGRRDAPARLSDGAARSLGLLRLFTGGLVLVNLRAKGSGSLGRNLSEALRLITGRLFLEAPLVQKFTTAKTLQ